MRMFEFFEDDRRYYVISELCKGGELFEEMMKKGRFVEKDAAVIVKQILTAVNHAHK
jgi:calcium-dependent protein kinase